MGERELRDCDEDCLPERWTHWDSKGGTMDCAMVKRSRVPVGYVVNASRIADRRMILAGYRLADLLTRLLGKLARRHISLLLRSENIFSQSRKNLSAWRKKTKQINHSRLGTRLAESITVPIILKYGDGPHHESSASVFDDTYHIRTGYSCTRCTYSLRQPHSF